MSTLYLVLGRERGGACRTHTEAAFTETTTEVKIKANRLQFWLMRFKKRLKSFTYNQITDFWLFSLWWKNNFQPLLKKWFLNYTWSMSISGHTALNVQKLPWYQVLPSGNYQILNWTPTIRKDRVSSTVHMDMLCLRHQRLIDTNLSTPFVQSTEHLSSSKWSWVS